MLNRLWTKIILFFWVLSAIAMLIGWFLFSRFFEENFRGDFERKADQLTQLLAENIYNITADLEPEMLDRILIATNELKEVSYIIVYDSSGNQLVESHEDLLNVEQRQWQQQVILDKRISGYLDTKRGTYRDVFETIYTEVRIPKPSGELQVNRLPIAVVRVGFSTETLHRSLRQSQQALAFTTILILLLTGGGAFLFLKKSLYPLTVLGENARRVALGHFDVTITETHKRRRDEIGMLARHVGKMIDYFKEMAGVARSISKGKLITNVQPRSKDDLFGHSFIEMVENLRQIVYRILESSNDLAISCDGINQLAKQFSQGSSEQLVSTEETSSTMVEIAAQLQQVAEDADTLARGVENTSSAIQQMTTTLEQTATNIDALMKAVQSSSTTAEKLEKIAKVSLDDAKTGSQNLQQTMTNIDSRSKEIGKVSKVIDDLADQTKLLALNAAIEAARAGEAGKGFAVVAEEVRYLAESSMKSTKEIGSLITTIQGEISVGVETTNMVLDQIVESMEEQSSGASQMLERSGEMKTLARQILVSAKENAVAAGQITVTADEMNQLTQQVANSTREQKRGGEIVLKAVESIANVSRQNVKAVETLSVTAENLEKQSELLKQQVKTFKI